MSARGTDNLRCYLRESTLPAMLSDLRAPKPPPKGHKSHQNVLQVRPEPWRRLESIYVLPEAIMEQTVASWVDAHIPEESLGVDDIDYPTGERLTIPCTPLFNIPLHLERRPSDIIRLSPWLDNLPLMTVQRVLHLLFPVTLNWEFALNTIQDSDKDIFQYFLWTPYGKSPRVQSDLKSVIIAFQPSWILSEQDMKEFSECQSFPPFRTPGNVFPTRLSSKERLWAKLWDICVSRNSPWFVLTSYNQWIFGAFSTGWAAAFVTSVYEFDTQSPTIIEYLTFWIASAMRIAGCCHVPEVPEPVQNLDPISIPPQTCTSLLTPTNSESNWDGKYDEIGSSAGIELIISPTMSYTGLPVVAPPMNRRIQPFEIVQNWLLNQVDSNGTALLTTASHAASTAVAETFEHSISYHGDWLM